MNFGPQELDFTFLFGKYEGYKIKEVFCGAELPSPDFIKLFINNKINSIGTLEIWDNYEMKGQPMKIEIQNFKLLPNNQIMIDHSSSATSSDFLTYLNHFFGSSEEYPHKNLYDSSNTLILEHNKNLLDKLKKKYDQECELLDLVAKQKLIIDKYDLQANKIKNNYEELATFIRSGIWPINLSGDNLNSGEIRTIGEEIRISLTPNNFDNYKTEIAEYVKGEIIKSYNPSYRSRIRPILLRFKFRWKDSTLVNPTLYKSKEIASRDYKSFRQFPWDEYDIMRINLFANPGYIFWAIKTVESFILFPNALDELEALSAIIFNGITLTHVKSNIYKYEINYQLKAITVLDEIKTINKNKYEKYIEEEESEDYEYEKDYRDDFNPREGGGSCDLCGGSGSCLLSDPQGCPRSSF